MNWAFWRREAQADAARGARARDASDGHRPDPTAALRLRARRRLIGAAVLLLAAVVLVPMVLDPAPRPVPDNLPIDIPSEKTPFSPRLALPPAVEPAAVPMPPPEVAVGPDQQNSDGSSATKGLPETPSAGTKAEGKGAVKGDGRADARTEMKAAAKPQAAVEPRTGAQAVAQAAEKAPARSADAQRAQDILDGKASAEKKAGRFVLQAAAMGSEKSALELAERLKVAGLAPYTEQVQTPEGTRWRVRVGPFATREDAEKVRIRLRTLEVNATLVPGG